MAKRKKIIVDIDGVVAQYDFPRIIKRHFGCDIATEDIYAYSIEDVLGVSGDDVWEMFMEESYRPPIFLPGAQEALATLHKNHDIIIYTNRVRIMGVEKLVQWLKENHIPFHQIIYSNLHQDGQFDYHIDDSPEKLMSMNGTTINKLLFDQPWNRQCKNITGRLHRVHNWAEVVEVINGRKQASRADTVSARKKTSPVRSKA